MRLLKKYRLEMRIFLLIGALLWIFTLYDYGFFNTLKIYLNNPDEINIVRAFLNPILNKMSVDATIIWGTNFFQLCISFIATYVCFKFYNDHKNINQLKYYRGAKRKSAIFKEILRTCFSYSFAIFLAYFLYYLIIASTGTLEGPSHYPEGILPRTLFLDLFGKSFYFTYVYWLLEGFVRFFCVPMIYAFFACVCSIYFDSSKVGYLVSNGYYILLSAVMGALSHLSLPFNLAFYLNPSVVMASGSYDLKTIPLLLAMLIPAFISFIMFWGIKKDA